MKVLIAGCTGMLGSMLCEFLRHEGSTSIVATARRVDAAVRVVGQGTAVAPLDAANPQLRQQLADVLSTHHPDYVVNCIGIIKPYCKDTDFAGRQRAITVNALFPYVLAEVTQAMGVRVIQIATDCVYAGTTGAYVESSPHDALDVYGKTKSLGEIAAPNFLNVRCSIVGPEQENRLSLLEWFLSQPDGSEISGFDHHRWNGVTTLQFAELCFRIMTSDGALSFSQLVARSSIHHYIPNETVTKYELLRIFADVYGRRPRIRKVTDAGPAIDRSLATEIGMLASHPAPGTMHAALVALREFQAS
jgi:dTDP-4-dehydrorhamnose reductase